MRNNSDAFILKLQQTKQIGDQVSKAHLELLAAVTAVTQIIGEIPFARSISVEPNSIEFDETPNPVDEKLDHIALYKVNN